MQNKRDPNNYSVRSYERNDGRDMPQGSHEKCQNCLSLHPVNASSHCSKSGVGFRIQGEDYQEERKKYLTAKYGSQQMKLIRKRLAVEFWIDEELKKLYNIVVSFE